MLVLKPFKDATTNLSAETTPILPSVYPTVLKLKRELSIHENDIECIKTMKTLAKTNLEKRYSEINDAYYIASFLHPRTKNLTFLDDELRVEIHEKNHYRNARDQRK